MKVRVICLVAVVWGDITRLVTREDTDSYVQEVSGESVFHVTS